MQERTLIITAIICIITGIPLLFFASHFVSTENPRVLSTVSGQIIKITEKDKITIIDVKMDNTIPVVMFEKTQLQKGDAVVAEGQLKAYKEKLEFVADKIELREEREE